MLAVMESVDSDRLCLTPRTSESTAHRMESKIRG